LSCGEEWIASAPEAMSKWIDLQVSEKSPEQSGSYQLRRIIRLLKYFAKVHAVRTGTKFPGGLLASALAVECYVASTDRDDHSFRETLRQLSYRSKHSSVFANGVQISDANDTTRIERLISEAATAVSQLDGLNDSSAKKDSAAKAWKKVLRHSFFDEIVNEEQQASSGLEVKSASLAAPALSLGSVVGLTDQQKADRMAEAVASRISQGGGTKPWMSK
jgi:hypothetical protein